MSDEPTGRLPAQIGAHSKRIREMSAKLTGHINAVKSLSAGNDRVLTEVGDMKLDLIGLLAELNAIDACIAAARMTGQIIKAPTATDLELHHVNRPDRTHELFARSLDRIGDDTLKEEGTH